MINTIIQIPGYCIAEQIYAGSRTIVYRAVRQSDAKPVVIKLANSEYPTFNQLLQFRNQYTIAKNLDLSGIVKPYSLEVYRNGYALIMEDFGGISLSQECERNSGNLGEFLAVAIQLATILDKLYQNRVIHKDIKPANILIHPLTKQVKLIDFSISSLLKRETGEISNPNILEGTLAYISPEQTGRMNRGIDYRSDFYSLGVTFYELLTRELPFTSDDPIELVWGHIAKTPPAVHQLNPDIPLILSDIVAKLMAKNAESRYQSALGLKHDLEKCLLQWKETGEIEFFELGQRDICDRFIIPEKLYGRDTEVATLLAAFDRVAASRSQAVSPGNDCTSVPLVQPEAEPPQWRSQVEPGNEGDEGEGRTEMMLVSGYSGIGKTAVVNEVHKPIVRQRGYFIKGKFDQFNRNIPLSAFVQAFRDLMGQLLSETDAQLEQWKSKIVSALGENGQVIIEVIPELEKIIGKQPTVQELSGTAAQNRFNLFFQKFISIFTTKEHPLVIFLDDLQWADSASLKLMQLLLSETSSGYLLLVGAYRDNEVFPAHPLMLTIEEIKKAKATVNSIILAPLSRADINQLIADTFSCSLQIAQPLTELVYQKTKGNPFFTTQFIKALYEDGLITFNFEGRYWQCDIAGVKELALTDDVVEFMAIQLQKLPLQTQSVLKLAACIGNCFDLATLAIVYEKSQVETAADLWKALQEGLILPTSEVYKFFQDSEPLNTENEDALANYKFLHDRVQQAAYSLIPDAQKQITHFNIGQRLLTNSSLDERTEKLFEIVNQLNQGLSLITDQTERSELAELNLLAGRKAKVATAYAGAYNYLMTGIGLLPADSWYSQYELTLMLHTEAVEVAYLSSQPDQLERLADIVLNRAKTILDTIKIYEVKIEACTGQGRLLESVEIGLELLEKLGIAFPSNPSEQDFVQGLQKAQISLQNRTVAELLELPEMSDPQALAALRILVKVSPSVFIAKPALCPPIMFEQVHLSATFGNAPPSAYSYSAYGLLLCGVVGDIETGYAFGQLALRVLERFKQNEYKARVLFIVDGFITHWKVHAKKTLSPLKIAYASGLETGDLVFAGYSAYLYGCNSYFLGSELINLEREMSILSEALEKINQIPPRNYSEIYRRAVLNLIGYDEGHHRSDESEMISQLEQSSDRTGLGYLFLNKLILCYLFQAFDLAIAAAEKAREYADASVGMFNIPILNFYDSLVHLAMFAEIPAQQQAAFLDRVVLNQEKMQHWAHHAPMNYQHKYDLVEAERYRVLGDKAQAIELYDRAIQGARINEYIQEEALSNELAAKFYLEWGKEKIAQTYLIEAYYCYARWGAKAKIDDLEQRYPQFLAPILQQEKMLRPDANQTLTSQETVHSTNSSKSSVFDLAAVVKATHALSSEIQLEQLLCKLMQVVIENAGANKGVLILNDRGSWEIAAQYADGLACSLYAKPLEKSQDIPLSAIYYVKRNSCLLLTQDVITNPNLASDRYFLQNQPKSLLCTPIINGGKLIGILYLENHLTPWAFTRDRIEVLTLLCSQAAISLENARLYQQSQNYAQQLEQSLNNLQQIQLQLVQSEKMSALGNLVAGVAHEINNPVGFLAGNLQPALDYIKDIFGLIDLYQQEYPHPTAVIEEEIEAIDLEFIRDDLPKLIASMKEGVNRIRDISTSLRTFSRMDSSSKIRFNIHEGLDSTILILKHRLKANEHRPAIEVVKNYGKLPPVNCFPSQLNQVFMNILANAIDSLEESNEGKSFAELEANPNQITIVSLQESDRVLIRIQDNGIGMSLQVKQKIFQHLFTTKTVGKGTGLGLSIARQIVVEQHGGTLEVNSTPGNGAEFVITIPLLEAN